MQKYFAWEEILTELIKTAWQQKARIRYVDKLCKLKGKVPEYVDPDVWARCETEWAKEPLKKKSEQNRQNRLGDPSGSGPSKHTGGSVSYHTHADRWVSITLKKYFEFIIYVLFVNNIYTMMIIRLLVMEEEFLRHLSSSDIPILVVMTARVSSMTAPDRSM